MKRPPVVVMQALESSLRDDLYLFIAPDSQSWAFLSVQSCSVTVLFYVLYRQIVVTVI